MNPLLEQVLKTYPEDVKLVYKSFPLPSHKFAGQAVKAAFAAGKQGKFWQMYDRLFENYQSLNEEKITALAEELQLDMALFENNRNDDSISKHIIDDIQNGETAGVNGTPTIFINGKQLKNISMSAFQHAIERELPVKEQS